MKKWITSMLCLALILAMAGCGNNSAADKPVGSQPAGVADVLEQGMAQADREKAEVAARSPESDAQLPPGTAAPTAPPPSPKPDAGPISSEGADGVDVDLTVLSSTMVYSEVYSMMASPESYIGKTVKMKGPFAFYHDEATGNNYFACIIQDATACCAQGLEFVLTEDYVYPDVYPAVDDEICVIGVFDTYKEGNFTYCTLRQARLV